MQLLSLFKDLTLHPKNADELKGLILTLALKGDLTSNWRAENPDIKSASDLLQNIEDERVLLIKEKKIKKEKELPPITDDEKPYPLPVKWHFVRLGSIIKISSGDGLTSANMDENGTIPVYGGNGITGYHSKYNVEKPEIVIGRVGYYCGSIHLSEDKAWVTDNAFVTRFSESNIYRDYLVWLLTGTNLKEDENATAQPVISGRKVYPIIVAFPPLEEQKAIVEVVNELFAEVEQLEELTKERISLKEDFVTSALQRLTQADNTTQEWNFLQQHFSSFFTEKANIKKLRETILQLAVQGKLTAQWRKANPSVENASELLKRIEAEKQQLIADKKIKKEKPLAQIEDEDKPYDLPDGWAWSRVGSVSTIKGGKRIPKGHQLTDTETAHMYIRVTDMKGGSVSFSKLKYITEDVYEIIKAYTISKDDLYITIAGTIGDVGVIPEELHNMNLTENAAKIMMYEVDKIYLKTLLSSYVCQSQFLDKVNQMAQPKLALHRIASTLIPLPPIEEQQAIVEKVNSLMALCDELELQIDNSQTQIEQLMQSCLKEVFEQESN
jgi:type I restriction enzyme, S subunit